MNQERERDLNSQYPPIQEEAEPRTREAFMSQYKDAYEALLELIDNGIDNKISDKLLEIQISVNKNGITVFNKGGAGLDYEGLTRFFKWGYPSQVGKNRIGFYGVGGKAAMGYLGRTMEVVCSPSGSDIQFMVHDSDWKQIDEWKKHTPQISRTSTQDGYFRVKVTNLEREVRQNQLIAKLSEMYRPLILSGDVTMTVNKIQVSASPLDYLMTDANYLPDVFPARTLYGETVQLKVGVLPEDSQSESGFRCYYRGRLMHVRDKFLGLPTPAEIAEMSRFIGEAHLDFVPVTTRKDSFDEDSEEYKEAIKRVALSVRQHGWIERIRKLQPTHHSEIEEFERKLERTAKKVVDAVLGRVKLITKGDVPGISSGIKPPQPRPTPPPPHTGVRRISGERHGATAPDTVDTVGDSVERWGGFHAIKVTSMGNPDMQAQIVTENSQYVLKINSDFSLYQAAKFESTISKSDVALEKYLAHTTILETCRFAAEHSGSDFFNSYTRHSKELGDYYYNKLSHKGQREKRRQEIQTRGTIRFNNLQ